MKYVVEIAVGYCATVYVEAESREEAVSLAKEMVQDDPQEYLVDIEIEQVNFVSEDK